MSKKILSKEESHKLFCRASELWEAGHPKEAFSLFMKIAEEGDASSLNNIGYMYDTGEGVERDLERAFYWYKKSWKINKDASRNIALLYKEQKKYRRAIFWWEKSVKNNDGDAALDYAKFLLDHYPKRMGKIINLLEFCINCKPRFNISEAGFEEAQELLERIKNKQ